MQKKKKNHKRMIIGSSFQQWEIDLKKSGFSDKEICYPWQWRRLSRVLGELLKTGSEALIFLLSRRSSSPDTWGLVIWFTHFYCLSKALFELSLFLCVGVYFNSYPPVIRKTLSRLPKLCPYSPSQVPWISELDHLLLKLFKFIT